MKLLTIDTATEVCGIALTENRRLLFDCRLNKKNTHNEKLVGIIQHAIEAVEWELSALNGIVVSIGPGSFTGLRIGLSISKGLSFSLGIPIVGVNTLDAFAQAGSFWPGKICAVIKARENELYAAAYQFENKLKRLSDYEIVTVEDFETGLTEGSLVIASPHSLGMMFQNKSLSIAPEECTVSIPYNIAVLGLDKFENKDFISPGNLEPFYLKNFQPKKKKYYVG